MVRCCYSRMVPLTRGPCQVPVRASSPRPGERQRAPRWWSLIGLTSPDWADGRNPTSPPAGRVLSIIKKILIILRRGVPGCGPSASSAWLGLDSTIRGHVLEMVVARGQLDESMVVALEPGRQGLSGKGKPRQPSLATGARTGLVRPSPLRPLPRRPLPPPAAQASGPAPRRAPA